MADWSTRTGSARASVTAPLEPVRTIRLPESVIESILQRLDQTDDGGSRPTAAAERRRFRTKAIIVGMQQPGDASMKSFLCPTRNVSRTGLSCLHGGYVHVRTRCTIQLTTQHGTLYPVPGTVVRCSLVERNIHEVGIQFEMEVDPELFCAEEEAVRVLLLAADENAARPLMQRLEAASAGVCRVATIEEALSLIGRENFDLLLLDVEGKTDTSFSTVKTIRIRGFGGTIVGLTSNPDETASRRIVEAGGHRLLMREAGDAEIKTVLEAARQYRGRSAGDDTMGSLIRAFVADLPKRQRDIQMAVRRGDGGGLRTAVNSLAEVAGSYGFKPICDVATKIENALNGGATIAAIRAEVAELMNLCARARA